MGEPRRRTSWRKRLLFAPLPLLFVLGAIEVGFRCSDHAAPSDPDQAGRFVADHELGWRLNPSASETNELGLRDGPYRADASRKILLLGDSVSAGENYAIPLSFAYLLEARLASADSEHTYEVINSGVPGYSTFQELRYLELHGLALKPDLVVLQFCFNDVVERYSALAEYGGANFFLGVDTRKHAHGLHGWLVRNSVAFEVLSRAVQHGAVAREEYSVRNLARDSLTPSLEEAWARAIDELNGVRRVCQAGKIPLLVVVSPYRFQLDDPDRLRQPQDRLVAWAEASDVPLVDLLPAFAATKGSLLRDANHFNEAGHALAAEALFEPVRNQLR